MTDGYGGAGIDQQHGRRFAHDIAAAHHHRFLSSNYNLTPPQDLDHARWCAGHQAGTLGREKPNVDRVKTVYIFCRIDREEHFFRIDLRGQRQLNEDSIDLVTTIQVMD